MKRLIALIVLIALITLGITGCGTVKPTNIAHEQAIGSVVITYDGDGNWIKIVSNGVAPLNDKTTFAVSEATKIAAMHAKQNIAEFINSDIHSSKMADVTSTSTVHSQANTDVSENDMTTLTTAIEHIKDDSAAVLRGVHITNQSFTSEFARVEVTVTKQSIGASQSLQADMNGLGK
jgi:hypothetical protein